MNKFDVVVIGHSLTGSLCAIEARARGWSVAILNHAENGGLEGLVEVPPTILNASYVSGLEFAARVRERIASTGIHQGAYAERAVEENGAFRIVTFDGPGLTAQQVIFAPAGSEVGAPELGVNELLGVGVSMDAWSDAPLLKGVPVAVLGGGVRAAEQAVVARNAGVGRIVVICENAKAEFGRLANRVGECDVEVMEAARIVGLEPSGARLRTLRISDAHGVASDLPVEWLFLARGVRCDWSAVGGKPPNTPGLIVAGLAAGIPYEDPPAMVADAQRAVSEVWLSA